MSVQLAQLISQKKYPVTSGTLIFSYKKAGSSVVNHSLSGDKNYNYQEWVTYIYGILNAASITGLKFDYELEEYLIIAGDNLESFIFKNTTLAEIFGMIKPDETLTDKNIIDNNYRSYYWGISRLILQGSYDFSFGNKAPSLASDGYINTIFKNKTTKTRFAVINNYRKDFDLDSFTIKVSWMGLSKREMIKDFLQENCEDNKDSELIKALGFDWISESEIYKVATEKYDFSSMKETRTKMLNEFMIDIIAVPEV